MRLIAPLAFTLFVVGCSGSEPTSENTADELGRIPEQEAVSLRSEVVRAQGDWSRMICSNPANPYSCRAPEPARDQLAGAGKVSIVFLEPALDATDTRLAQVPGKRKAEIVIERPAVREGQAPVLEKHATFDVEAKLVETNTNYFDPTRAPGFEYRFVSPGNSSAAGDVEATTVTFRALPNDHLLAGSLKAESKFMDRSGDVTVLTFTAD